MPLVVHFAVLKNELPALRSQLARLLPEPKIDLTVDDALWGHPDETVDILKVKHVTFETMTPMVHLNFFASTMLPFLIPMPNDYNGTQLLVTDKDQGDQVYYELCYPEVK